MIIKLVIAGGDSWICGSFCHHFTVGQVWIWRQLRPVVCWQFHLPGLPPARPFHDHFNQQAKDGNTQRVLVSWTMNRVIQMFTATVTTWICRFMVHETKTTMYCRLKSLEMTCHMTFSRFLVFPDQDFQIFNRIHQLVKSFKMDGHKTFSGFSRLSGSGTRIMDKCTTGVDLRSTRIQWYPIYGCSYPGSLNVRFF